MKKLSLACAFGAMVTSYTVAADDLCSVAPANCKILKEDGKVRVIEFSAKKGDKTPMHSHPAYVVYIVKGGNQDLPSPMGPPSNATRRTGRQSSMGH